MAEIAVTLSQHNPVGSEGSAKVEPGDEGHTVWLTIRTDAGRHDVTLISDEARALAAALIATSKEVERNAC